MSASGSGRTALTALMLALALSTAAGGDRLITDSCRSQSLHRTVRMMILLPESYSTVRRYPVLYLLHGLWGSEQDWPTKTRIEEYTSRYSMIVVMPDAGNSWYINSQAAGQDRYEDFMTIDLPRFVASHYAADTTHQAIAGLSMGGFGAFMLALRHPGMYRFAGSLSGAIDIPRRIAGGETIIRPEDPPLFGSRDSCLAHDVLTLLRPDAVAASPYFYAAVGIQDEYRTFLPFHREWTDSLRALGFRYEYHELPGRHSWEFWDQQIVPLLARLAEAMNIEEFREAR